MSVLAYERESFPVGASFSASVQTHLITPLQPPAVVSLSGDQIVFTVAPDNTDFAVSPDNTSFVVT